ncbi:MAG: ISL3 family transposase [Gammaproteobacteria bacterium]|nr:ISL3 family transposase [Gammaproteobacteria bacterium]
MVNNDSPDILNFVTSLLNFPDTVVTEILHSSNGREITLVVKSTHETLPCRICNKPTHGHGLGRTLRFRHLSLLGKETYIEITPRRGICTDCDDHPTTTERMDWYERSSKMTKPYEQHLLFELVNSTVADVSRKEGIDYHAVEALLNRYIETKVDFSQITALGVLGLDEISLKKGYRDFVTLVTYRVDEKVNVLGVVKGREKADIIRFLRQIPCQLHNTIQAACCDLYEGYMNACKEVFDNKVPVVADRFHVKKLYRKSLVTLRKSELTRLKKQLTTDEYAELKPAIALLKKHKDYFTDEEKPIVEKIFSHSPKLKSAYKLSRELSGIFDSHITPTEAKEKITRWISAVANSSLKCFNHFIQTLTKYQTQITNYFIHRNNSGFVEGFNNKVKVLKRRCYGLASATRLFQRLIVDTVGMIRFAPSAAAF